MTPRVPNKNHGGRRWYIHNLRAGGLSKPSEEYYRHLGIESFDTRINNVSLAKLAELAKPRERTALLRRLIGQAWDQDRGALVGRHDRYDAPHSRFKLRLDKEFADKLLTMAGTADGAVARFLESLIDEEWARVREEKGESR